MTGPGPDRNPHPHRGIIHPGFVTMIFFGQKFHEIIFSFKSLLQIKRKFTATNLKKSHVVIIYAFLV